MPRSSLALRHEGRREVSPSITVADGLRKVRGAATHLTLAKVQPHPVLPIEDERGGVGLAGLALETLELFRVTLCQELPCLRCADPFAGDALPDSELAARLPGGTAVGFLGLYDWRTALRAGAYRCAAVADTTTVTTSLRGNCDFLALLGAHLLGSQRPSPY